jgi:hypothetical protein
LFLEQKHYTSQWTVCLSVCILSGLVWLLFSYFDTKVSVGNIGLMSFCSHIECRNCTTELPYY